MLRPYGGNFTAALAALAVACGPRGLRLVLAFPQSASQWPWCADLSARGHAVRFLPETRSLLRAARAIRRIARQEKAVVIHTHFTRFDVAAWLAARLTIGGRHPDVIWHAHSALHDPRTLLRRMKNLVKYGGLGRTVRMIAVSEQVRGDLLAVGVPAGRVRTITNGIDLARARHVIRSKEQVFSELGIKSDEQLLLMMGWDPIRKGVDLALEAVGGLVAAGKRVVLGVLGTEALRAYLAHSAAAGRPGWLRHIPPTEDVASLYAAAAAFLSPSRSEGLTYAACEALAQGIPVVLSDIPSMAWARDCSGAVFAAAGDGRSLHDAIQTVLSWPPVERQRRAAESREFISRGFDLSFWAEQVVHFYHERT